MVLTIMSVDMPLKARCGEHMGSKPYGSFLMESLKSSLMNIVFRSAIKNRSLIIQTCQRNTQLTKNKNKVSVEVSIF